MDTIFIIAIVIISIIAIVVIAVIITAVVKTIKGSKKIGELKDVIVDKIKDSIVGEDKKEEFIVCEYCGTENDKNNKKCTSCGAKLNHNNKKQNR